MPYLEIVRKPSAAFRYAVLDFDGTVSLIRQGWQPVMKSFFEEELSAAPGAGTAERVRACVNDFVDVNTGKQTIYQCIALAEEIARCGGEARDPQAYKDEYHRRLMVKIEHRIKGLEEGLIKPEAWVVPGAYTLLASLKAHGLTLYLASGTDEHYVKSEAALLGVDRFFAGIHGAQRDHLSFSKKMVIANLIRDNALAGPELLVMGDGYVEIENGKEVGGYAIGVATEEEKREGIDEWKRERLLRAGADLIIPDYTRMDELISFLFGGTSHAV